MVTPYGAPLSATLLATVVFGPTSGKRFQVRITRSLSIIPFNGPSQYTLNRHCVCSWSFRSSSVGILLSRGITTLHHCHQYNLYMHYDLTRCSVFFKSSPSSDTPHYLHTFHNSIFYTRSRYSHLTHIHLLHMLRPCSRVHTITFTLEPNSRRRFLQSDDDYLNDPPHVFFTLIQTCLRRPRRNSSLLTAHHPESIEAKLIIANSSLQSGKRTTRRQYPVRLQSTSIIVESF